MAAKVEVVISVLDKYSKGLNTFTSALSNVTRTVGIASIAVAGLGLAAAGLAVKMGSDLVRTAGAVEAKLFDVAAVAGAQLGEDAFPKIKAIVDDLTIRFPVLGVQAGQALETIAQLGFGAEQQLKNLGEAAVVLGTATTRDIGMAASTLVSTLNAFKLGEEDATKVANVFAAAQFNSAAALEDLQVAMRYVGPVAVNLGRSLEETVTAVALLRDRGIEASMAGSQLRMGMLKLISPTAKGKEIIAKLGLTIEDLNPATHSFADIIETLSGRLTDVGDAAKLFGVRSGPLMMSLVDAGADKFRELQAKITGTTAATDAAELKMKSFAGRVNFVASSIEVLKTTIAGPLLEAVTNILGKTADEGLGAVVNKLQEMEKQMGAWGKVFTKAFDALADKVREVFDEKFHGSLEEIYSFGTSVFQGLIDITLRVAEAISFLIKAGIDLVKWWTDLDRAAKDSYLNTAKWFALLGPAVLAVGMLSMAFSGIISLLATIGGGMLKLGASMVSFTTATTIAASTLKAFQALTITSAISAGGLSGALGIAGLAGVALALGYAIGRLIMEFTGLDSAVEKFFEAINKNKEAMSAMDTVNKMNIRTLELLREKYGIEAKTIEEGLAKKKEMIAMREREAAAAQAEHEKLESIHDARIKFWYADAEAAIEAERTRTEGVKSSNQVLLDHWVNGERVYENTAEKARLYGDQISDAWRTTASFVGATPIKPILEDTAIRGKVDALRKYVEEKLGKPITIEVNTNYSEDPAPTEAG